MDEFENRPVEETSAEEDTQPTEVPAEEIKPENTEPAAQAPRHVPGMTEDLRGAQPTPEYRSYSSVPPRRDRMPWDDFGTIPEQAKPKRQSTGSGRRILAAVLAVVLLFGSCMGTAAVVSSRWEKKMDAMSEGLQQQITDLQKRVNGAQPSGGGISVSGTPTSSEGLTPAQVYAQNVRSVVAISANQKTTNIYGQVSETASSGSGFILTSDGYVATNHHVADGAEKLTVITYNGMEYDAKLIGSNATNDIALLKIEAEGLPAVTIGSSDNLIVGDMVVAIGNPLGELTSTQTVGYISAKDRTINIDGTQIDMMQTDAAINAGNSGGPLFNMYGEVVGITTAKYSGNTGSGASIEGIGFAIPIDDVIGMLSDLKEYGYITGAYLGVMVRSVIAEDAAAYGLPLGVYVESVTEGSCAEKAGVHSKDIIVNLGGYDVEGFTDLSRALRKFKAGETTSIRVYRAGAMVDLTITLDERPHETEAAQPTQPVLPEGQMPENGDFEEWFNFFAPFFGQGSGEEDN